MSDLPTPINRHEQYLNAIATGNVDDLPTPPITREEVFLDYIARNGGGGGGGAVTGVKGSAESTYRTGNVDISASNIGLGNVDNTADLNKPISTATQTALNGKVNTSSVGSANGVAELDANGKVPSSQLPSYVDDTVEGYLNSVDGKFYADSSYTTEITGETGKIYVTLDTNKTYRWSGSGFVEISESLALGETSSTAYAGNKGKANADAIAGIKNGTSINSFGAVETALAGKASTNDLGDKSNLTTADKSSCVGAINEINSTKAKKYTYYTSATGINAIDLTQISFDELEIVVIAPLTSYSCVFDLHVFKTDLSSTYLYYSTGNSTGNKSSMIKVGITQSLCILNTSICENVNVINDTVIKVYYR